MNFAEIATRGIKTMTELQAFGMALLRYTFENRKDLNDKRVPKAQHLIEKMLDADPGDSEWERLSAELGRLFSTPSPAKMKGKKC